MVILNWSAALAPRQRPARDEPTAGAYFDVSIRASVGLRSRQGSAEPSSRDARRRRKKRWSRRWNKRIAESDSAMRALGWRCVTALDLVLRNGKSACIHGIQVSLSSYTYCTAPLRLAICCDMISQPFNPEYAATKTRSAARKAATL
jgi:hypothetical protein